MILTGCLEDPASFCYHYCRMTLYPFALPEFKQEERVRGCTDLLITSTNSRVVDGARGSSGCKRWKTSFGVMRISPSSKEEGSGVLLEHR
ncbi:hypothetical protein J1N35_004658 [Gossypium stocksii]|uniref:Uncharacterized protein n=1 Tax=Gossypium stocksii TaxID=47602 RepID=A0A9D3WD51_9ROSI|nr:hypothetical protein J1N35_004658 [Gossypium stocksii]